MRFKEITLGNGDKKILDVDAPPKLIRRGTYKLEDNKGRAVPFYIIELAEEAGDVDLARVYAVKKDSNPPMKDFDVQEVKPAYRGGTTLGRIANERLRKQKPKSQRKIIDKPPLFIATIQEGIDTFTGGYGRGFYERAKDEFRNGGGKPVIQYGQNTGVFISLNSVEWEKAYVDASSLVKDYITDKELWFNLGTSTSEGPFQL